MDTQPQTTKPISDDQELAKALAGFNNNLGFEETSSSLPTTPVVANTTSAEDEAKTPAKQVDGTDKPILAPPVLAPMSDGDLDDIKKNALLELRPLMDKLELTPEEKFDIYLLLLRSTDDKTLIAPAHEAARNISDETKRAQALLDVIKEIDYLSNPKV